MDFLVHGLFFELQRVNSLLKILVLSISLLNGFLRFSYFIFKLYLYTFLLIFDRVIFLGMVDNFLLLFLELLHVLLLSLFDLRFIFLVFLKSLLPNEGHFMLVPFFSVKNLLVPLIQLINSLLKLLLKHLDLRFQLIVLLQYLFVLRLHPFDLTKHLLLHSLLVFNLFLLLLYKHLLFVQQGVSQNVIYPIQVKSWYFLVACPAIHRAQLT